MQKAITLFLSPNTADRVARESIKADEHYIVIPGVCRWDDGTTDSGFKVRIWNVRTRQARYL